MVVKSDWPPVTGLLKASRPPEGFEGPSKLSWGSDVAIWIDEGGVILVPDLSQGAGLPPATCYVDVDQRSSSRDVAVEGEGELA